MRRRRGGLLVKDDKTVSHTSGSVEPIDFSTRNVLMELGKHYDTAFEKGEEYRKTEKERWGKHSKSGKFKLGT